MSPPLVRENEHAQTPIDCDQSRWKSCPHACQSTRTRPSVSCPRACVRCQARPTRLSRSTLSSPLRSLPPRWPLPGVLAKNLGGYVAQGLILDQGQEGACTGFGLACVANYLLWLRHLSQGDKGTFHAVSARMFYELARRYDEWPGDDYEGSSCRGALKAWHKHGVCSDMLWPYSAGRFVRPAKGWDADALSRPLGVYYRIDCHSIVDLQAAITEVGAIYVSAKVHNGWADLARKRAVKPPARHADLPIIQVVSNPGTKGGHAFALVGYDERGFVVQNSWGRNWGASGFAILPYEDWSMNCTDAWACALGCPNGAHQVRCRLGRQLSVWARGGRYCRLIVRGRALSTRRMIPGRSTMNFLIRITGLFPRSRLTG